jgi:hypothetical protein
MDLISAYASLIQTIVTGTPDTMLHVHAGMMIYLGTQVLLGTRRASRYAVFTVLAAVGANEVFDWLYYGSWRWEDTLRDVVHTMFWPTACYTVGKFRRMRWSAREGRMKARILAARALIGRNGQEVLVTAR